MSLESFYGGKQGISPVIKGRFKFVTSKTNDDGSYIDPSYGYAIAEANNNATKIALINAETMDEKFLDPSYEDIWYNELCIIETENRNNPNNGKLYRRTLKGRGDSDLKNRTAEYIGRISGPAGTNPFVALGSLADVNKQGESENIRLDNSMSIAYPSDDKGTISMTKTGEDIEPAIQTASLSNDMLISGKDNNAIKYTWLNIIDDTQGSSSQSIVYMGFQIPYPFLEISAKAVDWMQDVAIAKEPQNERPFYHKWNINIPRGVRGNAAGNIRLAQWKDFRNFSGDANAPFLYSFSDAVTLNEETGAFSVEEVGPDNIPENNSYVFVYDYTIYNKINGDQSSDRIKKYTFYLGDYNEINDIKLEEDGTVKFIYFNKEEKSFNQILQWINQIEIDNTGALTVTYNTKDENGQNNTFNKQLPYPKNITLNSEGILTFSFEGEDVDPITLKDSTKNNEDFTLNYVDSIQLDENTKVLSYTTYPKNNGKELNNGKGLNYLQAMTTTDDYHLVGYYASEQYRPILSQQESEDGVRYIDQFGEDVTENLTNFSDNHNEIEWHGIHFRDGIIYEGIGQEKFWQDFGYMRRVEQGLRVMSKVDYSNHPDKDAIPSYDIETFVQRVLKPRFWDDEGTIENPYYNGSIPGTSADGSSLRGTFIYAQEIENGSAFYFDYNSKKWAYAGAWGESTISDIDIYYKNTPVFQDGKELSNTGIKLEERARADNWTNLLPTLWN